MYKIVDESKGLVAHGISACQGCGLEIVARHVFETLGKDIILSYFTADYIFSKEFTILTTLMVNQHSIHHPHHFRELGRNHQNRHSLSSKLAHKRMNLRFCTDIHATGRFIQNQEFRGSHNPL